MAIKLVTFPIMIIFMEAMLTLMKLMKLMMIIVVVIIMSALLVTEFDMASLVRGFCCTCVCTMTNSSTTRVSTGA
jgi:hypothetical protein